MSAQLEEARRVALSVLDDLETQNAPSAGILMKAKRLARLMRGAVRNLVGIGCGAFSGNMKVSFQAARSIG